jgi:hypothetical protein
MASFSPREGHLLVAQGWDEPARKLSKLTGLPVRRSYTVPYGLAVPILRGVEQPAVTLLGDPMPVVPRAR